MKDLIQLANDLFEAGDLKKSLNYFLIASTEIPDTDIWYKIGSIYIEQKKYDEAVEAFRSLTKLDPESSIGEDKLLEISNYYFDKGEALLDDRKFKPAEEYYQKALTVLRRLETLKRLATVYKQMNSPEAEKEILIEIKEIEDENNRLAMEKKRQELITDGNAFFAHKNYPKAIAVFESVLRMKVDQKIFVQLATIYKGLKKKDELQDLVQRWEKMREHEDKMKKFQREQEQEKLKEEAEETEEDEL